LKYILVPCTSSAPDGEHEAVVLKVDEPLLETLRVKRSAFDDVAIADLHAHEYKGGPVNFLYPVDDEFPPPDMPVDLTEHLADQGENGSWQLEEPPNVHLKVVAGGFSYTWGGRMANYGLSEVYETAVFTIEQLQALSPKTTQR